MFEQRTLWYILGRGWSRSGCFDSAKDYALDPIYSPNRKLSIGSKQLAWMLREITKAQLLAYHLGQRKTLVRGFRNTFLLQR